MSPFFNLPGELRNAVYDELWKMKNRVAARHHNTRTGILAYYDGMRLDEANVTGYCEIRGTLQDKQWSPGKHAGLPIWLLANKQVLKEGMSIFRANAHWNVWSLKKSNERFRQYREESNSDTWLMHPKYATSVTLCRTTISLRKMDQDSETWVHRLADSCSFGETPDIQYLHIPMAHPYLLANDTGQMPTYGMQFPLCYLRLIGACKRIKQLEAEIFHPSYCACPCCRHVQGFVETEFVQQIGPHITETIGGNVSEMVTMTLSPVSNGYVGSASYTGRQLFDRKVVYIRKEPVSEGESCEDH
jgi:hypothetical protein